MIFVCPYEVSQQPRGRLVRADDDLKAIAVLASCESESLLPRPATCPGRKGDRERRRSCAGVELCESLAFHTTLILPILVPVSLNHILSVPPGISVILRILPRSSLYILAVTERGG